MTRKGSWLGAAIVAGGLGASASTSAMQMDLTRAELCAIADAVIIAEVTSIDTLWAADEVGGLERHAFLDVNTSVKGAARAGAVVVLPGGVMGDFVHWVEDVPVLELDQPYALFLKRRGEGFQVIGGQAGAVEIATEKSWLGESEAAFRKTLEGCDAR